MGRLHKLYELDGSTVAFIKTLVPYAEPICRDSTTHAKIDDHILKMILKCRYGLCDKYYIMIIMIINIPS